jgi:LysM repeat protein
MRRTHVRWGRAGALATLACVVVTMLGNGAGAGDGDGLVPSSGAEQVSAHVYVVRPGDTLWEIAAKAVGRAGDPRPMVDRLVEANRIRNGVIQPGERLLIPSG